MAACARIGISHSHFLGGPPVWTELDRQKAVWFEIYERERCSSCGTRPAEWDPAHGGHDEAYVATLHKCWGCAALAEEQKKVKDADQASVRPQLERNPDAR
jgi:hypothetical protein